MPLHLHIRLSYIVTTIKRVLLKEKYEVYGWCLSLEQGIPKHRATLIFIINVEFHSI